MTTIRLLRAARQSRFRVVTRVTGRIARWQVALGALALVAFVLWRTDTSADTERSLVTLFAAIGIAPLLVDPAAVTLASSPTPRRARFAHRLVWATPTIIVWVAVQSIFLEPRRLLPPRWACVELVTLAAIVFAAELAAGRSGRATGLTGVAALLCFVASVSGGSRYVELIPTSKHELRIASLGAIAIAACCIASCDPAHRLNRAPCSPRQTGKERSISEEAWKSEQVGSSRWSPQL